MLSFFSGGGSAEEVGTSLRCGSPDVNQRLDGGLDERSWKSAGVISELTMVSPNEGGRSSFHTEVRILADRERIIVGIHCHDDDPSGIVSWSVARDSGLRDEDHIKIVFDTFGDGRTGYVFAVNPSGARYDALVSARGEHENRNWDGVWDAAVLRTSEGWSAEISIPISTLNFREGLDTWGFNVERRIQRLLETDRWANPRGDYKVTHVKHAGRLTNLPDFDLGMGLSVRPSLVGGVEQETRDGDHVLEGDISLDITQKLSPNLSALLTINTDFAETDVDSFRTNLTRFPLFFPEKRSFFLEGNEVFDFGLGVSRDAMPFHSRRIGLVDGEEVPLRLGGKIFGQVGDTNIGILGVNMAEKGGVANETDMSVMRVSQNILDESSIGFIATQGDPLGRHGAWTFGTDFIYQTSEFLGDKNFLAGFWGIAMDRDGLGGDDRTAAGFKIDYPNDLVDAAILAKRVGEDFDPSLGFVPRTGITKYEAKAEYMPYAEAEWIRRYFFEFYSSFVESNDGPWESYRVFTAPVGVNMESGDSFEFNVIGQGENLPEDFEISDNVVIPRDAYHWERYRVKGETASKRRLAGEVSYEFGPFYDGWLDTYEVELEWNPIPLLGFSVSGERNEVRLDGGEFTEDVYGSRVRFNFSPDLTLSSFVQFRSDDEAVGTNTRLRWSITPESNLYFVLNYNMERFDGDWRRESYMSRVKVEYTFRF